MAADVGTSGMEERRVVMSRRSSSAWRAISEVVGNPRDQGMFQRLIHPELGGSATEFFIGIYRLQPNEYHPRHYHPGGSEFYFVLSGRATIAVDDAEIEAKAGDAMYFPAGTRHAVRCGDAEAFEVLYGFSPPDLEAVGMVWEE